MFAFLKKGWKTDILSYTLVDNHNDNTTITANNTLHIHKLDYTTIEKIINVYLIFRFSKYLFFDAKRYNFCQALIKKQNVSQQFVCEAYMSLLPKVRRSPHPFVSLLSLPSLPLVSSDKLYRILGKYKTERELIEFPDADSLEGITERRD